MGLATNFSEYGWKHISLYLGGVPISTLQGISINQSVDKSYIYGERDESSTIISGRVQTSGTITMLQSDFELFNATTPGLKILEINKFFIVIVFRKTPTKEALLDQGAVTGALAISTYTLIGVSFTEWSLGFNQGDLNTTVQIPFIASRLIPQSIPKLENAVRDKANALANQFKKLTAIG